MVTRPLLMAVQHDEIGLGDHALEVHPLAGYSRTTLSKYSMKACLPSATPGLCCMFA